MPAVVVPAVGDTGTASWADSVANILNGQLTALSHVPAGNEDTPGAGTATWFSWGNVTVPTWASNAVVIWSLAAYNTGSASALAVTAGVKIGSAAGPTSRLPGSGATVDMTPTYIDTITGLATGTQAVTVSATFVSGTGVFRLDTNDRVTALVIFLP